MFGRLLITNNFCKNSCFVIRNAIKMEIDSDNLAIKTVLGRIANIKKKLLDLTEEVTEVQTALIKIKSKSNSLGGTDFLRSFSTSVGLSDRKRKFSSEDALVDLTDDINSSSSFTNVKKVKSEFKCNSDGYVEVYTDGACENNGRANAKAGLGVWFGPHHPLNISQPVKGRATNNCGEIQACTEAVKAAREAGVEKLLIHTDSQFVINSITKWIHGWKRNGWKLSDGGPVKNKEDFVELDSAMKSMTDIKWNHVRGHKGIVGNEAADALARQGAARYRPK